MTDARRVHQSPIARGAPLSAAAPQTEAEKHRAIEAVARNAALGRADSDDLLGELLLTLIEKHQGLDTPLALVKKIANDRAIDTTRRRRTHANHVRDALDLASNGCKRAGVSDIYDPGSRENIGHLDEAVDVAETSLPYVRGHTTCCAGIGGACPNDNSNEEPKDPTWRTRRTMDDETTPEAMRAADLKKLREEWAKLTGEEWTEETAAFFSPMNQFDDHSHRLDGEALKVANELRAALAKASKSLGPALDHLASVSAEIDAAEIGTMLGRPVLATSNGFTVFHAREPAARLAATMADLEAALKMYPPPTLRPRRGRAALEVMFYAVGAPKPRNPNDLPRLAACAWLLLGGLDLRDFEKRKARSLTAADVLNEEALNFSRIFPRQSGG